MKGDPKRVRRWAKFLPRWVKGHGKIFGARVRACRLPPPSSSSLFPLSLRGGSYGLFLLLLSLQAPHLAMLYLPSLPLSVLPCLLLFILPVSHPLTGTSLWYLVIFCGSCLIISFCFCSLLSVFCSLACFFRPPFWFISFVFFVFAPSLVFQLPLIFHFSNALLLIPPAFNSSSSSSSPFTSSTSLHFI